MYRNKHGINEIIRKRKTPPSKKTDCPFKVHAIFDGGKGVWNVTVANLAHNHDMLDDDTIGILHQHRKLDAEQVDLVEKLYEANASSFSTAKMVNNMRPDRPKTTVKDIINVKEKIRNPLNYRGENSKNLQGLMQLLESNGYLIEKKINSNGELTHLFFAHPSAFEHVNKMNLLFQLTFC